MNKLKIVSIVFSLLLVMVANAQKVSTTKVVSVQTNGTCRSCKEKIEQGLAFEKGVKDVEYDLETAIVKITYNEKKTSVEILRKTINKLGFIADGQKPENEKKTKCSNKKEGKQSCGEEDGHKH